MTSSAVSFRTVAVMPFSFGAWAASTAPRNAGAFTTGVIAFSSNDGVAAFFASFTNTSGKSFAFCTV